MKKIIALALALAMVFSFAACGKKETPAQGGETQQPTEKKVVLKLSSNVPSAALSGNTSAMAKGVNAWVETVQKESNGTIEVKVFPDAQLASKTDDIVTGIKTKAFEVAHFATGNWSTYTDAFAELNVPFLYKDFNDAEKVFNSEVGKDMIAKFEKDVPGIKALSYIAIGFRDITNNVKEVHTPADLKGIKIRTMNDTYQIAAMEALGCAVTPLSISELYSGLQQKLVDAQENPLTTIHDNKFYEVQKYCSLTNHSFTSTFMFMNADVYNSLSDNQKAAVEKANAACQKASLEQGPQDEAATMKLLQDKGMVITKLTAEETAQFQEACKPVWAQVQKAIGDARWNKLANVLGVK